MMLHSRYEGGVLIFSDGATDVLKLELAGVTANVLTVSGAATLTGNISAAGTLTLSTGQIVKGSRFFLNLPNAAAADVGIPFWIAPAACKVVSVTERHVTVCDAADTMTLEKVPSGTAPGAGTDTLAAAFTLNSAANTNVTKNAHGTPANAALAAGDALALKFAAGDGTNYAGAAVTVLMEWV
jgi:hypothetical protein